MQINSCSSLSDSELVTSLGSVVHKHRSVTREVLMHLAEFDRRKLYLGLACPSLFAYCVERLHFSESEAYKRINATRAKLLHIQDLMRHSNPTGDVETILDKALSLLVQELEAKVCAKPKRAVKQTPPATPPVAAKEPSELSPEIVDGSRPKNKGKTKKSRYIPREVRREVMQRDGLRCSFQDPQGQRCQSRSFLQLHHVKPFACGGPATAANLKVFCSAHNQYQGRLDFGEWFPHNTET